MTGGVKISGANMVDFLIVMTDITQVRNNIILLCKPNLEKKFALSLDPIYTGLVTTVQVLYLLEICCRG